MPNVKTSLILGLIALVNLAPAIGASYALWPWDAILYFYWAECALLGGLTLILYAKHLLVFFIILLFAGLILSLTDQSAWGDLRVPLTFWSLYALCWLFYFEFGKSELGRNIKHSWDPPSQFGFYFLFMFLSIVGSFSITAALYNGWTLLSAVPLSSYGLFLLIAALIPTLSIGALKIIDMVGARHFIYFLTGTYHRPVEREKIVLFLDMVGSSQMAEKLPPKQAMALIARFIFDAGTAFRMHGGDILNYTGDGLVVLWPIHQADRALNASIALESRLENAKATYKKCFGQAPDFRIGMHAGQVVISQIGEEKLFLGLYGDVVNTTARIEQMNKELNTKILISKEARARMSLAIQKRLKPMGAQDVRGRNSGVELYTPPKRPN